MATLFESIRNEDQFRFGELMHLFSRSHFEHTLVRLGAALIVSAATLLRSRTTILHSIIMGEWPFAIAALTQIKRNNKQ